MKVPAAMAVAAVLLALVTCASAARTAPAGTGTKRIYYLAANEEIWDFAPAVGANGTKVNACHDRPYSTSEGLYVQQGIGSRYLKARFVRYLDAKFRNKQVRPAEEEHLGIMGPLLRAAVGDTMEVHLFNNLSFPINLAPGGVAYSADDAVLVAQPGKTVTYTWSVPEQAGPTAEQNSSSAMWLYRSTVDQAGHADAGLVGPIIITRAEAADADARPTDVDREYVTMFQIINENVSPYLEDNVQRFGGPGGQGGLDDDDFEEANLKHSINGFLFCNVPALKTAVGERVRWHTVVQGNEADVHNVHWHGLILDEDGSYADQFNLLASVTRTARLITDNPGTWLLHCHVNDHFSAGMLARVTVAGKQTEFQTTGVVRKYYVQAEEVEWDYAPSGSNMCSGKKAAFTDDQGVYTATGPDRIGGKNIKALYVEYTDATFTTPRVRTAAEQHLGFLGPVIRAEVGDTVVVEFRNKVRFPTTIHVHGIRYNKSAEGSPYSDGTSGVLKRDDGVPTNGSYTYVYDVPERAGPGPAEPSSKIWMYHSHADEAADTYAGLMGAIIVSRRGTSRPDGTPIDVDREFVLFFSVMNEANSLMFIANLNKFLDKKYIGTGLPEVFGSTPMVVTGSNSSADSELPAGLASIVPPGSPLDLLLEDEDGFQESNLKHSVNGYLYCNLPGLEAMRGQRARFYIFSLGTEADLHSPNLAAATLDWEGQASEALTFLPGNMETADAQLTTAGQWLLQCRTGDHITAGMQALFTVKPAKGTALPATDSSSSSNDTAGPQVSLASATVDAAGVSSADILANGGAAIYSSGVSASANVRAYSAAAAGSSSVPLLDLAFSVAQSLRDSLFLSGVKKPSLDSVAAQTPAGTPISVAVTRTYYIQAERLLWNYAPAGIDRCEGRPFQDEQKLYTQTLPNTVGPKNYKAMYRAYTDNTFKTSRPHSPWLGVLGPLIQAQVGDVLEIVFRNSLDFEANLVLGGGLIPVDPVAATAPVKPGETVTLVYQVPNEAGPQESDPSTVHYVYYSSVDIVPDQYTGLVGVVMVAKAATLTADGRIPGIDVIQPLLFNVWDESKSLYFNDNVKAFNPTADQQDPDFEEGNLKHGLNGYLYCNMPDVLVKEGGVVRWLLVGMGTENDMHSPVFHGQVLEWDQKHVATTMLFPAVTRTADMRATSTGIWRYNCDVQDHIAAGMEARLVVTQA